MRCKSLSELPDISKWKTENIEDLCTLFYECESLEALPDISQWNTHKVKNISGLFYNCQNLRTIPDISKWNVSNVIIMAGIFFGCKKIKRLPDISKWNIEKVINLSFLFFNCENLEESPDISKWNIFKYAKKEDLDNYLSSVIPQLLLLIDFKEIKNFVNNDLTKNYATDLFLVGLEFYFNFAINDNKDFIKIIIENNYSIANIFSGCSSLKSLPDISKWDTSKVTNLFSLFAGCSSLKSLPDISIWKTGNVTMMGFIFRMYIFRIFARYFYMGYK